MSPSAGRHRSPDVVRLLSGHFRARRRVGELERAAKDSEATERALMFLPDGIEPADPTIQVPNKTYPVSYGAAISLNQFGRPELRIHVDRRIEAVVGFAMTVNSRSATTSPISGERPVHLQPARFLALPARS